MVVWGFAAASGEEYTLHLRSRLQPFKSIDQWQVVTLDRKFDPKSAAIVICDMWDKHWCPTAAERVRELAVRMDPVLKTARQAKILIVHAPSDTIRFYENYPQRKHIAEAPKITPPKELNLTDPPLPIDDSDGGCDTHGPQSQIVWSRENALLTIGLNDVISDNGLEIYSYLRGKGVHTVFMMGVHTNMCVLNRTFAIKQLSRWGMQCILVRDMTDAMYDPADRPYVSHRQGTELVIEHIEKYWCPTTLSAEFTAALTHGAEQR